VTWLRSTGLRLALAIGLGLALWVFVTYTRNPDLNTSFDSVPVNITGLSPGLVVVDNDGMPRNSLPPVKVTVEADADTLKNVQQSTLQAYVDLSGLGPGEHQAEVLVAPNRQDLKRLSYSVEPVFLPVRIDQEITRTVPLTVEVSGIVPFSFERGQAQATVQGRQVTSADVRGPQSRVDLVKLVRATANIDRITANYNSSRPLEAIGDDGSVVDGVTVYPTSVIVQVPITSSAGIKRVPVVPQVSGRPASGYIVTGVSVEPQFVRLTGSSGPLDSVMSISTAGVDIGEATRTISRSVPLQPPANTGLASGEPDTAIVTVQIAAIARPFQVRLPATVQAVDVPSGLLVSLSPQVVQVTLVGTIAPLAAVDQSALEGTVSLRGLGPGTYTIVPSFKLPAQVSLAEPTPKVTVVLRVPPSPTPVDTPTAAETAQPTEATVTPTTLPPASSTLTPTLTITP
jgi:YbbR domain-containing protein